MAAINELVAEALNEPIDVPRGLFRARNPENKVKPTDLAFKTVYGRFPVVDLQGNENGRELNLDSDVMNSLNSIQTIEIRSICQGHNKDRVAHIIFIPKMQIEKKVQQIVEALKKCSDTFATYDRGNQNRFRICVAAKLWFEKNGNNSKWESWWHQIPNCIAEATK